VDLHKTVLIFPCGTEIGLELHRALKYDQHLKLIGATSGTLSNHGSYVFNIYIDGLPFANDPAFLNSLNKIIHEQRVDLVIPAHDDVALVLSNLRDDLQCQLVCSCFETCMVCRSKSKTYDVFSRTLRTPVMFDHNSELIFPVFMKPDAGQGSQGAVLVRSQKEMEVLLQKDPSLLVLEYLPGEEYTVDCFTDRHGQLRFAGARTRARVRNGISVDTQAVIGQEFQDLAHTINKQLQFRGMWFFQVKQDADGGLALLEIAPRLAGGMALYRNLGVNFPLLSVYDALGYDVDLVLNSYSIQMDRALENRFHVDLKYENVYVDLEGTLLLRGGLNKHLMVFLLECKDSGTPIHLLSRCEIGAQRILLDGSGLSERFFDSITYVSACEPKSRYIKGADAIFIDDSFQERKEVHDALGIPVFAPDAIESLLDWRM